MQPGSSSLVLGYRRLRLSLAGPVAALFIMNANTKLKLWWNRFVGAVSCIPILALVAYYFYWASKQPGAKEYDAMQQSRQYEKQIRDGVAEVYGTNYQFTPQDDALTRAIAREAAKQAP